MLLKNLLNIFNAVRTMDLVVMAVLMTHAAILNLTITFVLNSYTYFDEYFMCLSLLIKWGK